MSEPLEAGFALDRRWHWLRGEMERSKEPDLACLARIFQEQRVPYAIIGGVALQVHQSDPRTTLDVDVAVESRGLLPRASLTAAGFRETGRFEHSDNWLGSDGTPVQFTDDPALLPAVARAMSVDLRGTALRVIQIEDLLHEKIRAGGDPSMRRSKRLQDLADAQSLLEQHPDLAGHLSPEERALLDGLPS